jgi:hypothetical protein
MDEQRAFAYPIAVPGIFVGANAFLICRPQLLRSVASSAPGSAPSLNPIVQKA